MKKDNISVLERERNYLLSQWIRAKNSDKVHLLVKIMDIDEQLELGKNPTGTRKQLA